MYKNKSLDDFELWCPICGRKTIRKSIYHCKFILCENFLNCNYFKIIETNQDHGITNNEECKLRLKQFIKEEIQKHKKNMNINNKGEKPQYTLKENEIAIDKNTEFNDINLIKSLIEKNRKEKTKIEILREESRRKRNLQKNRRFRRRHERQKEKIKERNEIKRKEEEKVKKEELLKQEKARKRFRNKYESLFNTKQLAIEKMNNSYFTDEEIDIGLQEYEKEQILIKKELQAEKEAEKRETLKKLVRKL
ncbi:hypothetical protein MBCUT_07560 [Methanobrevibacter cuticularis]|uniref:Uncharacterized protein n=1 Tax=Methanobrevibacter cuticularis TaxID=47311 RepID=A0A166ED25_9EURY|nr:hypothetical protein [Methanobrevibacter cuticularis]KZX16522.1 hypothetical protein MBCUT_07560 [Methanobrevibacter cuticularis]